MSIAMLACSTAFVYQTPALTKNASITLVENAGVLYRCWSKLFFARIAGTCQLMSCPILTNSAASAENARIFYQNNAGIFCQCGRLIYKRGRAC